ncbi:hypothetical protein [Sinorhizobium meliloti]|uniref:hypothetical protein n=1 Tax=Rhizobium meliloti TaxID=382 RepID=UPI003F159999
MPIDRNAAAYLISFIAFASFGVGPIPPSGALQHACGTPASGEHIGITLWQWQLNCPTIFGGPIVLLVTGSLSASLFTQHKLRGHATKIPSIRSFLYALTRKSRAVVNRPSAEKNHSNGKKSQSKNKLLYKN